VSSQAAHRVLSEDNVSFRSRLLELLNTPLERFFYLDGDTSVCVCPVCDGPMAVHFGDDSDVKAILNCHNDCTDEIIEELQWRAGLDEDGVDG
jgi:hypothetical protein